MYAGKDAVPCQLAEVDYPVADPSCTSLLTAAFRRKHSERDVVDGEVAVGTDRYE